MKTLTVIMAVLVLAVLVLAAPAMALECPDESKTLIWEEGRP